ncbi:hypothetical protein E3E31_06280 [Thermococcus sp. M39]|uniref:LEA type 2 family protein n=1 Tax=unclassified Thermococcus TaxID=2627626 RepID=UPI001439776A|nr:MULTISPECIES: LEA type 2 family protein [unclassified Thermococcus]NJE08129.1 hypothetical protein [Thermococcus sp. M39]NJE11622.1 hypothetical protein [Thermococcus sp. LS2]
MRVLGLVVLLISSLILGFIMLEDSSFVPPEVKVTDLKVSVEGLASSSLNITLSIYNPNKVTITVMKIDYNIYGSDNVAVENGRVIKQITIPPNAAKYVSIQIKMKYGTLKAVWGAMEMDKIEWRIIGKLYMKVNGKDVVMSFEDKI